MSIATDTFLELPQGRRETIVQETRERTVASPITMRRFGPSGSFKNTNDILEQRREVMQMMSNDVFFDITSITRRLGAVIAG